MGVTAGDFEIIMELPRGQHEIKFVINGETWRCHPDLEARKDTQVACLVSPARSAPCSAQTCLRSAGCAIRCQHVRVRE